ncbi:MAG: rhodanese-like domain-containing protein [Phycisphaerales bacterium]|nr:rhodanese-like domain-containing protein [Phycisphaerales bacterium]
MRHTRSLTLALLLSLTAGCSNKTSDRDLQWVTAYQGIELLAKPTGAFGSRGDRVNIWMDPRTPTEYAEGHIPGSISLPFPMIEQDHQSLLRNAGTIIIYDTNWNDVIAVSASKRLMELGYSDIYTLRGGLEAWKADGNAVDTGAPKEATEEQAGRR